jgi:hypothetical protein
MSSVLGTGNDGSTATRQNRRNWVLKLQAETIGYLDGNLVEAGIFLP